MGTAKIRHEEYGMKVFDSDVDQQILDFETDAFRTSGRLSIAIESFSEFQKNRNWIVEHLATPSSLLMEALPSYYVDWNGNELILHMRNGAIEGVRMV